MLEKLKVRFKEWRRKRKWNAELQLYHLRLMVLNDNRWMAHNQIVSELTDPLPADAVGSLGEPATRERRAVRERIGLDPHKRSNVVNTRVHDLEACLRDLIATIDLHTDCMDNRIDREPLDDYIARAEDLLGETLEEIIK